METRNILKKISFVLIGLSFLLLIGLTIFQHLQIKKLSQGMKQEMSVNNESTDNAVSISGEAVQKGSTESTAIAGKAKEPNKDDGDDLSYQLEAAEEEVDMANKQLSDELARKAEIKKKEIELQKKYMQDPRYKQSARKSLDSLYGDIFKELNLSPEKLETLKDILVDRQMASMDIYTELQTVTPSEEKRTEFEQRYKDLGEEYQTKIKELLGNNDYEKYQAYQERASERNYVSSFMELLSSDNKMTEAQQQKLVDSMYEERKNIALEQELSDDERKFRFPSEMYEEKILARMIETNKRTYEAYLEAAKSILSASQTEQFKTYLKQRSDTFESSMKLQALRYGTQTTQESTDKKTD